jgi:hypothetical protein
VRINNDSDPSILTFDLLVHQSDRSFCKVVRVEEKVIVIVVAVTVRPLNVHPEDVDREPILSEVSVAFNDHLSINIGPFTEVEA